MSDRRTHSRKDVPAEEGCHCRHCDMKRISDPATLPPLEPKPEPTAEPKLLEPTAEPKLQPTPQPAPKPKPEPQAQQLEILPDDRVYLPGDKITMRNVHRPFRCTGRPCVIHRPTAHHMSKWPLHWRPDVGMFERICEHGIGHPDPDQIAFWNATNSLWRTTHGCDGCCAK